MSEELSLAIEWWPVERIRPYETNPRAVSKDAVKKVAKSIETFGWRQPIVVDDEGVIIVGHRRHEAALLLGLARAPVHVATDLTPEQVRAYRLADNRVAEESEWDDALLRGELRVLSEAGFDCFLTGFGADELASLLMPQNEWHTDPDEAPPAPPDPVAQLGDLWTLGRHRVICGDSTSADVVGRLLAGGRPGLMVTDPPYGVKYDPNWRNEADRSNGKAIGARAVGVVRNDDRADWREAWALFPGDVAYVWHGSLHVAAVQESLAAANFTLRAHIVWVKTRPVISRGHYHWQHEPCLYLEKDAPPPELVFDAETATYAVRLGKTANWQGGRKQSTVWTIEHVKSESGHGTQKPVEAMRRPILNNSLPGQDVYDPFLGSGTTVIAAEMEARTAFGCELNPAYVDVIVNRWQDFTRKAAVLDGDGRSFAEIAAERVKPAGKRKKAAA